MDQFNKFVAHINSLVIINAGNTYSGVRVDQGKVYRKIVKTHISGNGGSVWGFVDAEGNIFKAAGWSRPAKHARGNIYKEETWKTMSWTGPAYLK